MKHLQIGLKKARHHPKSWIPSVGEFISWCKPTLKDFGLPEPHMAFKECCTNAHGLKYGENIKWSHQAVYHAGSQTGWFDIEKQEKLFMINYDIACKIVFDGGTLRDLPKLISFQYEIKSTPQNALNGLNELKKILGIATIKS
jgi:hypothetical protein